MQDTPLPTEEQLVRVREAIGANSLLHSERMTGGLGCTMDLLSEPGGRLVLRRYGPWYAERGEDAAAREMRALELLQRANIPAPAPIWIDRDGVFDEQAIVISYVDGKPDLTPSNPFDWAERLALTLIKIHEVRLSDEDRDLFKPGAGEDIEKITQNPELVLQHPLGERLLRRRVALGQEFSESASVFSHTDYWPGNTLWSDGDLNAVIDWESPGTSSRAMDVAYCSMDIRYLGLDKIADRFIATYREASGEDLKDLVHWESVALCRPMPDIAEWVPAWNAFGRNITVDDARSRYTEVLEEFLERTG
ncbi:MAG: aminoglycoside phosphotransferase family protein [Actinobacteria bacterium]|nr:MAG: aminoglycoside phosphotransferase family protein [Actinomycetota bacterium]REK35144.1 MAG: aminoglycoside phosphotransferase family protein [Actinomycetota bacterium]